MLVRLFAVIFVLFCAVEGTHAAPKKSAKKLSVTKNQAKKQKIAKANGSKSSTSNSNNEGVKAHAKALLDIIVEAKQAILIDAETGTVLLERQTHELMNPSSMTKIMTAYLVFERLKAGTLKSDTIFTVDKDAWRVEGSTMFLNLGDQVKVEDLLKGIVIQSGNDACVVLAKGLCGSEIAFANEMTRKAQELGAKNTKFTNSSGLPHPEHLTTVYDLAIIGQRLIKDFPEYYSLFSEKEFTYGGIKQGNRNPLLYNDQGMMCDGIKTGHTKVGGHGIIASCKKNNQRLILVINGLESVQDRADDARKIISWGMRTFSNVQFYKAEQPVVLLPVSYGNIKTLSLTVEKDILLTVLRHTQKDIKVHIEHPSVVRAPVTKGQELGKLLITIPEAEKPLEFPLIAAADIKKAGFIQTLIDSVQYLLFGADLSKTPKVSTAS